MAFASYAIDYWDSIDIGLPELNHSQGFFRRTHSLHEKDAEFPSRRLKNIQTPQSVDVPTNRNQQQHPAPSATNINAPKQNKVSNKENVRPVQPKKQQQQQHQQNRAILAVSIVKSSDSVKSSSSKVASSANTYTFAAKKSGSIASSTASLKSNVKENNGKPGMIKSISHQKLSTGSKLYEYAEVQKKKKEELVKKLKAEEERELKFQFHAKPVPKFVKVAPSLETIALKHQIQKEVEKKKLVKQQSMPNLQTKKETGPLIPSCADPERLKARAEMKKKLIEKYKPENIQFKARDASVLQRPVFQPKHNFRAVDAKPFKLTLTTRMIQRSTFDKQFQENQAMRERQKEIMQRQKDLEERKVLRKDREFKARPYPQR